MKSFEERGIEMAEVTRAARYTEEVTPLPGKGSKKDLSCNICGRIYLSKANIASYMKSHQKYLMVFCMTFRVTSVARDEEILAA